MRLLLICLMAVGLFGYLGLRNDRRNAKIFISIAVIIWADAQVLGLFFSDDLLTGETAMDGWSELFAVDRQTFATQQLIGIIIAVVSWFIGQRLRKPQHD